MPDLIGVVKPGAEQFSIELYMLPKVVTVNNVTEISKDIRLLDSVLLPVDVLPEILLVTREPVYVRMLSDIAPGYLFQYLFLPIRQPNPV